MQRGNKKDRKSWTEGPVRMSVGGRTSGAGKERTSRGTERTSRGSENTGSKLPVSKIAKTKNQNDGKSMVRSNSMFDRPRADQARSSSSSRTPMSEFTFRKPYNSSAKSRVSGRGSTIGSISVRDTRPLSDKTYQSSLVRRILDFLRENGYRNDALTSKHFPLSTKEFTDIFNFTYSFINPDVPSVLPYSKAEDLITNILKNELNYPGTISKSNLITMGSLHSWPTVLGCLSFLVESAKVHLKVSGNIIPIAFPCKDEQGFPIDRESKDKMRMEYFTKTYNMFMREYDEYPEEEVEYKDRLQDNLEIDIHQLKRLDEEVRALHEKNEQLKAEAQELREMKESLEKVLLDQKKVEQYHHNLIKKKSDLEIKQEQLKMYLEEVNKKLENMEQTLNQLKEENRCFGNIGVNLELQAERQRSILQTEELIKQLQSDKWQLELEIYRDLDSIEKICRECNTISMEIGLKSGEEFLTLPTPGVKDGTVTRPPGLSTIQTELSSLEKELKSQNQVENQEINKIKTRLEANQGWLNSALKKSTDLKDKLREVEETLVEKKARIEKEESTLDQKISSLKSQMLQLRSDSQV
ncbi:kinetochore protein NDC80 homolog [Eurytemora carolleeae]|uniref:kinetochore protein NDC80 homolog n=1 Tax=Eurytemora carolleeae TaxID=1294199 RepID=UPI000C77971D|nr:kinetochore protein NDC80 homolog [Eurytemora carolleeae]|eukprot:XP_023331630.1 kinetochore protein NDC80 homolog [Eurytemora affinis]